MTLITVSTFHRAKLWPTFEDARNAAASSGFPSARVDSWPRGHSVAVPGGWLGDGPDPESSTYPAGTVSLYPDGTEWVVRVQTGGTDKEFASATHHEAVACYLAHCGALAMVGSGAASRAEARRSGATRVK